MSRAKRLDTVPDDVAAASGLSDPSYSDVFAADVAAGTPPRDAEEWSRLLFEESAAPVRWFLRFGWRVVFGFKLGPTGSTDHILGWKVAYRRFDLIRLEQQSRILRAALVTRADADELTQATFVCYQSRIGRVVWHLVGFLHRRIVPYLLTQATTESVGRSPRAGGV